METIAQGFVQIATSALGAKRIALVDMKTREEITYEKLLSVTLAGARRFQQQISNASSSPLVMVGIEEGKDLVGIELAAWLAGFAVCPFDCKRDPRLASVVTRLQPDYIVVANEDNPSNYVFENVIVARASDLLDWNNAERCCAQVDLPTNSSSSSAQAFSHMVFTSGTSTGEPKCVGVSNKSLALFALAKQAQSRITAHSRVFLASSLVFDPQLGDIATALTCGAALVLPDRKTCFFSGKFRQALLESQATHVTTTPAVLKLGFNLASNEGEEEEDLFAGLALEEILVGGERMTREMVERLLRTRIRLVNTYGVTEACVYQTAQLIQRVGDESLLGEAYSGVCVQLLEFDSNTPVQTPGCEGEIVLSGPFLARGYLVPRTNCDGEVRAFSNEMGGFHGSHYRTGDVGLLEESGRGRIRYLGRRDGQCKVNGVRIEAEEVEFQLMRTGLCQAAVVAFREPHLVAFCAFRDEQILLPSRDGETPPPPPRQLMAMAAPKCVTQVLFKLLAKTLPATHIPSRIVAVHSIPLSATGKVDRRALLQDFDALEHQHPMEDDNGSSNSLENSFDVFVQHVWAEVLGLAQRTISAWDSFQSLGGDSLQALKVVNKILSRIRDVEQEVVQLANVQSQVFGEIEGPFSALALLGTPSLQSYVDSLRPYIPEEAFASPAAAATGSAGDAMALDASDPDPGLSRALLDLARLGLRHALEAALVGFDFLNANGRFQPRKFPCKTPLHEASQFGQLECVQLLLERGAKVMAVTEARISPLHLASTPEICTRLVAALRAQRPHDCSTPMFICDKNDQTPIHFAARAGRWQVINAFIEEQNCFNREMTGKGMNLFDHWRRTPLHWAVVNFHTECARFLLDHGCLALPQGMRIGKPGPGTHLIQETPLQIALRRGAPRELVELLERAERQEKARAAAAAGGEGSNI